MLKNVNSNLQESNLRKTNGSLTCVKKTMDNKKATNEEVHMANLWKNKTATKSFCH